MSGILIDMSDKNRGLFTADQVPEHIAARFWANVNRSGSNDCWNWKTGDRPDPDFRVGAMKCRTSQLALILSGKPRPPGLGALHSCDNPRCCNPAHLRWGTQRQNMADKRHRNRGAGRNGSAIGSATHKWIETWTAF